MQRPRPKTRPRALSPKKQGGYAPTGQVVLFRRKQPFDGKVFIDIFPVNPDTASDKAPIFSLYSRSERERANATGSSQNFAYPSPFST